MFGVPAVPGINRGDNGDTGAQIRGNGFQHDGAVDTVFRFLQAQVFNARFSGRVGFASLPASGVGTLSRRPREPLVELLV